jgi:DNA-binding NarL/FixJ family response regulator
LQELEVLRPGLREGADLPTGPDDSSALKRALRPESDRDLNSVLRLRVRARSGRWLTLYGSLAESVSNELGETVIVIEPAKPEEVAWMNIAAHVLSPREEEVVMLIVRSFSTKQISAALYISEYTIQNHISKSSRG